MKSNDTNNKDNFTVFLSCSIALHLLLLYFFLFGMPSLFEKLPEEQTITFEMLPISEKANIITQTKQKEAPIENEDAKKSEQTKPKEEKPKDLPKEEKAQEPETKPVEEKPKIEAKKPIEEKTPEEVEEALPEKKEEIKEEKPKAEEKKQVAEAKKTEEKKEEKKPIEKPKEEKKQEPKTDELDSLLKNLEQSSEGDNVKSNKHKRSEKVDNKKEAKGVYSEGLPLSDNESSSIRRQIERNWSNIPAGARGNKNLIIFVHIVLDKAGNVEQAKVVKKICPGIPSSICEALSDSAVRAVWKASPIDNLDPARFHHWKECEFTFNPGKL
ncbi:energy transducer TonB [Rickettsia endosymbiont of Urophora cardui]|uniref:energy transducer TonB n=1 Tax=Rickettsia endosymbiont of Urophora cardui TaxID=3066265 RepID=UPI00313C600D